MRPSYRDVGECTVRRLFTVEEARVLLPRVRTIARDLRECKAAYDRHHAALEIIASRAGSDDGHLRRPLTRHQEAVDRLAAALQARVAEVNALGVEIKGIEQGLLDFPSVRDGRIVYLCWKLDEPDIAFWHDLETGFRGRRPL